MIFDTHVHYDDEAFDEDREELLDSLEENGIGTVVNVSSDLDSVKNTLDLTEKYPFIYGAVGIHPGDCEDLTEDDLKWLKEVSRTPKVVAIGEIGLDYHWDTPPRDIQKYWFKRQLELAGEESLPVIIHSRDAAQDTLDIIKEDWADTGGVIHCFSYSVELAREYLGMGFYIGIGGVLTFKNSKKLKEVAEYTPIDRIVLETDCPYMAPEPNRGKRNSSLNLPYVVSALAAIKGMKEEEVIRITEENARRLYKIDEKRPQ